jgi:hypothetical protein
MVMPSEKGWNFRDFSETISNGINDGQRQNITNKAHTKSSHIFWHIFFLNQQLSNVVWPLRLDDGHVLLEGLHRGAQFLRNLLGIRRTLEGLEGFVGVLAQVDAPFTG